MSPSPSSAFQPRKVLTRVSKTVMKSHHFRIPKYDLPLRLRPWFLVFTCLVMIILAFLGFTGFSSSLPLNDKLLHFICFCIATAVFYFIFDAEEEARRIWFWRHSNLIFTTIVCCFFGGIVSEFVQSMLPYKQFDFGDILANLLGCALGLYTAYYLERYYRHRREISRLYRPINSEYLSSESDLSDSEGVGTQLLPTHYAHRIPHPPSLPNPAKSKSTSKRGTHTDRRHVRLGNVWDEREELFDIGEDSEEEEERRRNGLEEREEGAEAEPQAGPNTEGFSVQRTTHHP